MDDEHVAVVAHGLMNSVTAVVGCITTARRLLDLGPDDDVERLLDAAGRQAQFVADSLRDLIVGMPPELRAALDRLDERGS